MAEAIFDGAAEPIVLPQLESRFSGVAFRSLMTTPDQETLLRAIEDAWRILGEYIEPGPRKRKPWRGCSLSSTGTN